MRDDPIANVLDNLTKLEDVLACMVARQNMISVMPTDGTDSFKPEINPVWDIIHGAMENVFTVIRDYSPAGLGKMTFEVQDYEVLFYVFPDTENALVAVIPPLAHKGLIEIALENARRKILEIMDEEEKKRILASA